jgi:hypothetical protein
MPQPLILRHTPLIPSADTAPPTPPRPEWRPATPHRSAEEEIASIRATEHLMPAQWMHWIWHPDERVVLELIGTHGHKVSGQPALASALSERALAATDALWHPLLDEVSRRRWVRPELARAFDARAQEFARRLSTDGDEAAAWDALRFGSSVIARAVARAVPTLSDPLFERLLSLPDTACDLACRPDLDRTRRERLIQRAVEVILHANPRGLPEPAGEEDDPRVIFGWQRAAAAEALRTLADRGHYVPREDMHRAIRILRNNRKLAYRQALLEALLRRPDLEEEDFAVFSQYFAGKQHLLATVSNHPRAPLSLIAEWVRLDKGGNLQNHVVKQSVPLRDPCVRQALLEYARTPYPLGELLRTAPSQAEAEHIFRRLAEMSPLGAIRALEERAYPDGIELGPAALTPLLQAERPDHRLRALGPVSRALANPAGRKGDHAS